MQISMKATGMNKARNMMAALAKFGAAYTGIEVGADARKGLGEKGTNADVTEWLAEGGRDLGPSEKDATAAAKMYVKHAEKFLRMQTDTKKPPSARAANQACGFALRRAAEVIRDIMTDRINKGEDMNGNIKKVTKAYATARAAEFEMADDQMQVFKASGQLLANFASGRAKLKT